MDVATGVNVVEQTPAIVIGGVVDGEVIATIPAPVRSEVPIPIGNLEIEAAGEPESVRYGAPELRRDNLRIDYLYDYSLYFERRPVVEEVSISEFKAKCIGILDRVNKTRRPVRVTRHGKPVARVVPDEEQINRAEWIASMQGSGETLGDIISPATDEDDWEVLRD